jgi:hypothetical protein
MMQVEFLLQARSELADAVAYYEGEQSGLGQRLWEEVDRHVAWISANSELPRLRPGGYRRVNLKIFPYYIRTWSEIRRSGSWRLRMATAVPNTGSIAKAARFDSTTLVSRPTASS